VGPGDDAAVVRVRTGHVVVSTDLLIEGRHFRRDWASAEDVGHRAAAQNLSDINAMGGTAHSLTIGLGAPPDLEAAWALDFARGHGVLPIAAEGNEATDLGNPTSDDTSPDYPVDAPKERTITNACLSVPTESKGVVAVSSTGPSTRKAYYSNYGTEQTDVAAPGGDVYDTADGTRDITRAVLAAFPKSLAQAGNFLNPDGTPNTPAVVQSCKGTVCGYYQYLQGTSMAAPHAVGVASLIVSQYGVFDFRNGGLTLPPFATESKLLGSAVEHACPTPRTFHYKRILPNGTVVEADHTCEGPKSKNGFYGRGIVNAKAAVTGWL
jgi:subtilisin family serine protease